MATKSISRRDILKTLTMGAMAGSVLRVIPAQAAEYAHHMVAAEKAATTAGVYTPKFFSPQQYKTLQALCQAIIPADADSGGAEGSGRAGIHRPAHQRESQVSAEARRRHDVAGGAVY